MIKQLSLLAAFAFFLAAELVSNASLPAPGNPLEADFLKPPHSARPWVYWYFMDGNMTKEGLTADLEAMRQAGIGGAIFLEVNIGIPRGPVDFMSPQWLAMVTHAAQEADRLGIEIALGTGPGWCGTGGPWVKPEQSMQHLVASETNVTGPQSWTGELPRPQPRASGSPAFIKRFGPSRLTPELKQQWQDFYRDTAVLAFPTPDGTNRISEVNEKAFYYRDPFSSLAGVKPFLSAPTNFPRLPTNAAINPSQTVELTKKMLPDGHLTWEVPPGRWTIMRLGYTSTGQTTRPAPKPGLGFESGKFDRAALDAHFAAYIQKLLARIGPHTNANGGLTMLHFDSWEMSSQNWSAQFRAEFKKRRGYDLLKFLPAFTGQIVASDEISERFLWDVRQTAQELIVANHAGYLGELAHRNGLKLSIEPYDMNPCGDLTLGRVADVPQCEFWHWGYDTTYSVIEAASIAHTGGRSVVAAEAFTSEPGEDWKADPAALKAQGDWAFCTGVNRIAFHRMQHQPATDRSPGMTMGRYGVHWDRTQTWWDMVSAYHDYLARCQYLLQRGVTVADICFLAAEGAPHVFRPPASASASTLPDHTGYNFDGCAPETLIERAQVKDGKIIFPGGTRYQILVLPERQTMTPTLLKKIKELVRGGATVFGPPPIKSPSLEDYPQCDGIVQKLAKELWGDIDGKTVLSRPFGKGRIFWQATTIQPLDQYGDFAIITNLLNGFGVPPDFVADGPIRFTHRTDGGAEFYFLANSEERTANVRCQFRVSGKQPELWNPLTGETRMLTEFESSAGGTSIPMRFEPLESGFVVFRQPTAAGAASGNNFPAQHAPDVTLTNPWEVSFDPKWGGPEKTTFDSLADWSLRPETGIRHYSGKAVYRKTFRLPDESPAPGQKWRLDLGVVKNLARVRLNGRDLGVIWCAPWRVDVSRAIRPGKNDLEIEVANLWPNRLIGDRALPAEKQFTSTTYNPYKKDSPLLPSGLLGPVTFTTIKESR